VAVVSASAGRAFACTFVVPAPTALTGIVTDVAFAGKEMEGATVATPGASELSETTSPAGAGALSFRVRLPVAFVPRVKLGGEKLSVAETLMACVSDSSPGADAVMLATPKFTPVTCGCLAGATAP